VRRKDIEQDLDETRGRGYSINRGEFRAGVCGIAVPIRDRSGGVVASVGVWGAEKNIIGSRREELAYLTMAAARDISQQLGYIESPAAAAPREAPVRTLVKA